jgi:murein DD-endopeptidase MepM/ murein hydrolase activator NlpD
MRGPEPDAPGARPGAEPEGPPAPGAHTPPWAWPLEPEPEVTRYFLPPPEPWKPGHRGVDLAAAPGAQVLSPADGIVTFVGEVAGRPVLSIGHDGGLVSSFLPVHSGLARGGKISRGGLLGTLAGTGTGMAGSPPHCAAPCLHWGVRLNGTYVNPLSFVTDRRPSVLLPLRGGPPAFRSGGAPAREGRG